MKSPRSHCAARAGSALIRVLPALALVGGALGFGGCSTLTVSRNLDSVVALAPAPVLVKQGQELRAAEVAASHLAGA